MTRPVGSDKEARALILRFLRHVGEARIERVIAYMKTAPRPYKPGTTRNTLSRLVRAGQVARVGYGRYRIAPGEPR